MSRRARLSTALVLVLFGLTWAGSVQARIQKSFTYSGGDLTVTDMIGKVEVMAAAGEDFTVEVRVMGSDASEDILAFAVTKGDDAALMIQFPLDEHDEYVYPPLGRHGRTTISYREDQDRDESWIKKILSGITSKRVTVRGRGDGLEVWADVTIGVPEGGSLTVVDRVGEIHAEGVDGNLDLDTSSGAIVASDIDGNLRADTGSGSVDARDIRGEVLIDTGSGYVVAAGIEGPLLDADTGSGSVDLQDIKAGKVHVDTGSGSVELAMVRMGKGRFEVDTGSGGIRLKLPPNASARISAETSSGTVTCSLENAKISHKARDEMQLTVGDGDADVTLDTGSGSIIIE